MDRVNPSANEYCGYSQNCGISWAAVLAGAFASLGLAILMNLLNTGLGFSAYAAGGNPTALVFITFIWVALTVFVTMFLSGLIAGCLAHKYSGNCWSGVLHGFIAWCVGLVFMLILTAHLSMILPVNLQAISSITNKSVTATATDNTVATSVREKTNKQEKSETTVQVDDQTAAGLLGALSLQAFFIFLIGAIASSIGGYCGMRCHENKYPNTVEPTNVTGK